MSFSSEVKDELLGVQTTGDSLIAMGYGMLLYGRCFSRTEISLLTEHQGVANAYADIVKNLCSLRPEVTQTEGHKYKICITDHELINEVFSKLGIISGNMMRRVNFGVLETQENKAAFLRGVFLSCGTVVDPQKEYHLEFAVSTQNLAKDLCSVFQDLYEGISFCPKITERNGAAVLYIKKSENIEDTLGYMGAHQKCLEAMQAKIEKELRNKINRGTNFENANLERTSQASAKQFAAIQKIKDAELFDSLPEELKEIAEIRLQDRELSSSEISGMLKKPLSVSGVNHRFAKLIRIAEAIE